MENKKKKVLKLSNTSLRKMKEKNIVLINEMSSLYFDNRRKCAIVLILCFCLFQ